MALINRFSRLFTADLHAILDRIEEPEALLKQAVREMEEELAQMSSHAQSLRAELERLESQESETRNRITKLDEELDVCFESSEETLARSLVKRKLETERHGNAVTARKESTTKALNKLESAIGESDLQLAGMRQKLEVLVSEAPKSAAREFVSCEFRVASDEIEVAFLREKQRRAP